MSDDVGAADGGVGDAAKEGVPEDEEEDFPETPSPRPKRARRKTLVAATTHAPKRNLQFLNELKSYKEMSELTWGELPYADVLEALVQAEERLVDEWVECGLASRCERKLRLVPDDWSLVGRPVVSLPKLLRYAVLLGAPYLELDLVSSHPRQILKYARAHGLPRRALEAAFGARGSIGGFRARLAQELRLPVEAVKSATNMLCYGSSLSDWRKDWGLGGGGCGAAALPEDLELIKFEVACVRRHYWENVPPTVRAACHEHARPQLAALSVMCQEGERRDLDRCVSELTQKKNVLIRGYLNDSFFCDSSFDGLDEYIQTMEARHDILLEIKGIPQCLEEYLAIFRSRFGRDMSTVRVDAEETKRLEARAIARKFFFGPPRAMRYCPDLKVVQGICHLLPVTVNPKTLAVEIYDDELGRWRRSGGQKLLTFDKMSDKLLETYFPTTSKTIQIDGKLKVVPSRGSWDHSAFLNSGRLKTMIEIACNINGARFKALDEDAHEFLNFDEPICMDFSRPTATPSHFTDELVKGCEGVGGVGDCTPEELRQLKEVLAPLRRNSIYDRSTRHMPHKWKLYDKWRDALKLMALLQAAEDELRRGYEHGDDDDLSDELKAAIYKEAKRHHVLQHIFIDAFTDLRESLYNFKFQTNACNGKSRRKVEYYTALDDGDGCTCKSTLVDLLRVVLGVKDKDLDGYMAILKHSNLMVDSRPGDAPCESVSNMQGCVMAVVDDFHAAPSRCVDLDVLHRWTGKSMISAARKYQGEVAFIYYGAVMMMCNRMWKPNATPGGADDRRFTGQMFTVFFKDKPDPTRANERKKDKRIKETLRDHVPEFIFWILVMYRIRQACEDSENTVPYPPSTEGMRVDFMMRCQGLKGIVASYVEENLTSYEASRDKPSSIDVIVADIVRYAQDSYNEQPTDTDVRQALKALDGYRTYHGWAYRVPNVAGADGRRTAHVLQRRTEQRNAKLEYIYETLTIRQ
jgi:hypothetical protein